jgi:murein DD-endopeptidase MepM/ murein hydrolase activator NlpD
MIRRLLFLFSIAFSISGFSQGYVEKDIDFENMDLLPPMKIPLILAGNFGEMRSNHFHTGLDIKTKGVEGQKLYSIDEGIVSRVRVSPWGYGLAVYVDHPNGLTSLYAHMQSFSPAIDSLVYAIQKEKETYVVDENVLERGLKVKRDEFIGLSGNSGSSMAAHLHFEIRETATEHVLNPLKFKCYQRKIKDSTKPTLKGIKVYAVNDKGYMLPGRAKYYHCKYINGKYEVNNGEAIDVTEIASDNSFLGFAFHVVDKLDGAHNICGVHNTQLSKGEEIFHEQKTDYIDFEFNRYLNSHQDYYEFRQNKRNVHKNFKTPVNELPIYPKADALFKWNECAGAYKFKAFDVHGNLTSISFNVVTNLKKTLPNPLDKTENYYFPDSVNTLLYPDFQLLFESGSFYEPLEKIFKIDSSNRYMSNEFTFSESEIPANKYFDVRLKTPELPKNFPVSKLGIGVISDKGYLSYRSGQYIDGWVESTSRSFGKFVLMVDSVAPVITPLDFNEGKVISKYRTMELKIEDNLSGVWKYRAYINEAWCLMYYNRRKKKYVIPLDSRSKPNLIKGKNKVRINALDSEGNEKEQVWTVIY